MQGRHHDPQQKSFEDKGTSPAPSHTHRTHWQGLSEAKVDKIKEAAGRLINLDFISGLEVEQKRKNVIKVHSLTTPPLSLS